LNVEIPRFSNQPVGGDQEAHDLVDQHMWLGASPFCSFGDTDPMPEERSSDRLRSDASQNLPGRRLRRARRWRPDWRRAWTGSRGRWRTRFDRSCLNRAGGARHSQRYGYASASQRPVVSPASRPQPHHGVNTTPMQASSATSDRDARPR
jgi:hypothetical protein